MKKNAGKNQKATGDKKVVGEAKAPVTDPKDKAPVTAPAAATASETTKAPEVKAPVVEAAPAAPEAALGSRSKVAQPAVNFGSKPKPMGNKIEPIKPGEKTIRVYNSGERTFHTRHGKIGSKQELEMPEKRGLNLVAAYPGELLNMSRPASNQAAE